MQVGTWTNHTAPEGTASATFVSCEAEELTNKHHRWDRYYSSQALTVVLRRDKRARERARLLGFVVDVEVWCQRDTDVRGTRNSTPPLLRQIRYRQIRLQIHYPAD